MAMENHSKTRHYCRNRKRRVPDYESTSFAYCDRNAESRGGEPNFRLPHRRVLNIKKVKYMLMLIISHKWVNLYLTVKMDIN